MRIEMVFMVILLGGCEQPPPVANGAKLPADPDGITQAQPKLPAIKLFVGAVEMEAEQALTARQIETGMMFRKTMGENEGMIFVFQRPNSRGFWMKNCPVPMSAAYIDPQGRINEIIKLEPHETKPVDSRSSQIQYVLEAPRGWFKENGLGPGVTIMTPKGTLQQTYFPGRQ